MGSAESKVAAQPLAVISAPSAGAANDGAPRARRSGTGWPCNVLKKQNKTAPAATAASTAASTNASSPATKTPRSTPTMEAVKTTTETTTNTTSTSLTSTGPSAQILANAKAVSLHQLSFEELSTQLLKAVKNGDQRLVERVVELAASKSWAIVNIRGMWESTPLIYACQYCHERIALWLVQKGADVHLVNEKGVSALLLASLEGMATATEQILLRHGAHGSAALDGSPQLPIDAQVGVVYNSVADVNVRANPLLAASMNGHKAVVKLLLQHGADVNCGVAPLSTSGNKASVGVNSSPGVLQFPLLVAAKYGHAAVVELLIEHGAAIDETDGNENHALLLACDAAKEDCALALLRLLHASSEDQSIWKRCNVHGFTPLHFCAVHGLALAAEFMLHELGWEQDAAFVNATSSTRQESAVLMAVRKKQLEVAKLLIRSGADATLADRGATTALDVLKRDKQDELVVLWEHVRASKSTTVDEATAEDVTATASDSVTVNEAEYHGEDAPVEATEGEVLGVALTETLAVLEVVHETNESIEESQLSQEEANDGTVQQQADFDESKPTDTFERNVSPLEPLADGHSTPSQSERDTHVKAVDPSMPSIDPTPPTSNCAEVLADASLCPLNGEAKSSTFPEPTLPVEETSHIGDETRILPQEAHEFESLIQEAVDLVPVVPRKPKGGRSKSTSNRRALNRRPTGFAPDLNPKAKSLSSLGLLSAAPLEENEDEDADDGGYADLKRTGSSSRNAEDPNEDDFSAQHVGQLDLEVGDEMSNSAASTQAATATSKPTERHKKKKRHSKKKHSDATPSPRKETATAPSGLTTDNHVEMVGVSVPSVCIPESSDQGDLDDDF